MSQDKVMVSIDSDDYLKSIKSIKRLIKWRQKCRREDGEDAESYWDELLLSAKDIYSGLKNAKKEGSEMVFYITDRSYDRDWEDLDFAGELRRP